MKNVAFTLWKKYVTDFLANPVQRWKRGPCSCAACGKAGAGQREELSDRHTHRRGGSAHASRLLTSAWTLFYPILTTCTQKFPRLASTSLCPGHGFLVPASVLLSDDNLVFPRALCSLFLPTLYYQFPTFFPTSTSKEHDRLSSVNGGFLWQWVLAGEGRPAS